MSGSVQKVYEIVTYRGGAWRWLSSSDDRDHALAAARDIDRRGRHLGLKVVEITYDQSGSTHSERTIFRDEGTLKELEHRLDQSRDSRQQRDERDRAKAQDLRLRLELRQARHRKLARVRRTVRLVSLLGLGVAVFAALRMLQGEI